MTPCITTLTFLIISAAGVSESVLITQWPHYISNPSNGLVKMHCYQNDTDYQYLYWYKQPRGKSFQLIVATVAGISQFEEGFKSGFQAEKNDKQWSLTITSIQEKDEAVYLCAASAGVNNYEPAYFGSGTKLTVLEQDPIKPNVTVLAPSVNECKNKKDKKRKKTLVCVATEFYPDHVKVFWQIDGKNITDGVATDEAAERIETPSVSYRITSRLRVSAKDWFTKGKNFSCIVSFYNGTGTTKHFGEISGIEDKEDRGMGREKYLMITNKAKLSYAVFIFKSCLYGAFVGFLVWRLQSSPGKRKK
ncbi:Ig heavy chain Mem5-like [Pundamilia nyererei]|uniref:Ig heavy chain Mem5-like n=1 Tax=Pundamilia nyererei TaxID=303518 RepID=A0A9Y6JC28_9CICH|nr:PREDICTED: Ig heavy chain Mem5-like [Pundamilia nyererei]